VDTTPSLSESMGSVTIVFGLLAIGLFWIQSQGIRLRVEPKEDADSDGTNPLRLRTLRAWSPPDRALHEALAEAGIHMRYVPITDLSQGSLHGVEAMIQWDRPGELPVHVSPAEFIGLAERNDLVLPFEDWALKTAFSQVGRWHRHHGSLMLNFNISAKQFNTPTFPARIRALCAEFGLPHQAVALEIHEGMLVHMSPQQLRNFVSFDAMGRARMQELSRVALVRRIPIAAEGLKSVEQERAMKLMGCRLGQGSGSYQSLSAHALDAIILQDSAEVTDMTRPWRGQSTALMSVN
jgi:EAL domain-containing protein (putative c-di-GMP-specific phosphodiesterase class I)